MAFLTKGPPGEPSLKLRVDNDPLDRGNDLAVLRAGQTVELRCTAQGGNPVPTLTFFKNGLSFGPGPKPFQNKHEFVATEMDNGANLSCSAANTAVDRRVDSQTVRLNVLCKYLHVYLVKAFTMHALLGLGIKTLNHNSYTKMLCSFIIQLTFEKNSCA